MKSKRKTPTDKVITIKDVLDRVHERNQAAARRDAQNIGKPKVGIFWVVNQEPFTFGAYLNDLDNIDENDDFVNYKYGHDKIWEMFMKRQRRLSDVEYSYFSRGRVVYHKTNDVFFLYVDGCIKANRRILLLLRKQFNLQKIRIKILTDEHYKCRKCGSFESHTLEY